MKYFLIFLVDLALILVATLAAFALRENFEVSEVRFAALVPYLVATALSASAALLLFGTYRAIWRYVGMADYMKVAQVIAVTTIGAVGLTFGVNRLDGIARSLPFLQFIVASLALVATRVAYRSLRTFRAKRKASQAPLRVVSDEPERVYLVVGVNRLTEAYLLALAEFAPKSIKVAGLLATSERQVGRALANYEILGIPENVEEVVTLLQVHGVFVDRIIVGLPASNLSDDALASLSALEAAGQIEVQFLVEGLGIEATGRRVAGAADSSDKSPADGGGTELSFVLDPQMIAAIARRPYWMVKRAIDVVVSAILIVLLAPVAILVAAAIAVNLGLPLLFWQQRPGLGGRPFRLYKFRTMGAASLSDGQVVTDDRRVTALGVFLRRTRLDEFPQLFSILLGDMSIIGPRPLLPKDQSDEYRARLLVRPGLAGWAQVVGGRDISPADKAALDVWYIRNASLWLDLSILARTVPIVLFGERTSLELIQRAWQDLARDGVLRGRASHGFENDVRGAA